MATHRSPKNLYETERKQKEELDRFYTENLAREREEKKKLKEFNASIARSERTLRTLEPKGLSEEPPEAVLEKSIGNRFVRKESIEARAYDRTAGRGSSNDGIQNARSEQYSTVRKNPAETLREEVQAMLKERLRAQATTIVRGRMSMFTKVMTFSAMGTVYLWQLLFAFISIAGFGIHVTILEYQEGTIIGKLTSLVVDITKVIPADLIGWGAWGLCTLIVISAFICFLLWYELTDVRPLSPESPISLGGLTMLISFTCLALSIIPVMNLFPWLLLWVVYINVLSVFNTLKAA